MKPSNPKDLISEARKAPRAPQSDVPEMPDGFADRVVADLPVVEEVSPLRIFEWASYGGVAVAAGIAVVVSLSSREPKPAVESAADPWLEMPMSEDF